MSTPDSDNANDNAVPLEELMMLAALDESATMAFYDALVDSTVFVPGAVTGETEDGPELELHVWQTDDDASFIPVFTSEALLEEATEGDPVPYLSFVMRDLLAAVDDAAITINPESDISLTLEADEIQELLNALIDDSEGDDDEE
ncbi:SseB family protein [Micavibrio aeruginosavorus]|uniref:SseB family protein n=1 Tax=Micavibrio aeruginosavorus TaxID=349221 RepID=UPI003F4A98CA